MISLDTNVLFAALIVSDTNHDKAAALIESLADRKDVAVAEQVLVELYGLLRNPVVLREPLSAKNAVRIIDGIKSNPNWMVVDVPADVHVMKNVWRKAARPDFPRRRIHDMRLAETLRHWNVDTFYTRNIKDFADCGFSNLINPF